MTRVARGEAGGREGVPSTADEPAACSWPAMASRSAVSKEAVPVTPMETDARDYLEWMEIHNYAETTIGCRGRYLGYFVAFAKDKGMGEAKEVTLELLLAYQHALFAHRKRDGRPLSFGTQAQRLVPVGQWPSPVSRTHGYAASRSRCA